MTHDNGAAYDKLVDEWFPRRGPCAFCGTGDARHRVMDAIGEMIRAGDDPQSVAEDYGVPLEAAEWCAANYGKPAK